MSATPSSPYVSITTPTIERANRLLSLKTHPGFNDIIRLSEEIIAETVEICNNYPGWDKDQMALLFTKQQAAKGHHQRLLYKINEAIEMGTNDQRELAPTLPSKSAEEIIEQGDFVRQEVLTKFAEMDDNRIPGSY
jgi:hypothetical protein